MFCGRDEPGLEGQFTNIHTQPKGFNRSKEQVGRTLKMLAVL